jgi:hypothetical protein
VSTPDDGAGGAEERVDLSGLSRLSDRPPAPRGERTIRIVRGISVLLLAIAAAGLPWYIVTRGSGEPKARSSPTSTPSGSASPTPTATAATYEVFNLTSKACLRIREQPTTGARILTSVCAGVQLSSDGQTAQEGSRLWRRVYYKPKKIWGWSAAEYLKPVP